MAKPCAVSYCPNIGTRRFPQDETRKAQWIQAIKETSLTLSKTSTICSAHFRKTDFVGNFNHTTARKWLKKTAIPSVFAWNKASQEQPLSSVQEYLPSFNPSTVQAINSRVPITDVEEQTSMTTAATDLPEDPLQCNNHELELWFENIQDNQDECGTDNEEILRKGQLHVTEQLHAKQILFKVRRPAKVKKYKHEDKNTPKLLNTRRNKYK